MTRKLALLHIYIYIYIYVTSMHACMHCKKKIGCFNYGVVTLIAWLILVSEANCKEQPES